MGSLMADIDHAVAWFLIVIIMLGVNRAANLDIDFEQNPGA